MERIRSISIMLRALALPLPAAADPPLYSVEFQNYLSADPLDYTMPEMELLVLQDLTGPGGKAGTLGVYGFALVNRGPGDIHARWGQIQFGLTYWVVDGLEWGLGGGLEQGPSAPRAATFVFVDPSTWNNISALAVAEYGFHSSDDYYYTSNFGYHVTDFLRVGGIAERFLGVGPRLDLSIPSIHFRVHAAVTRDLELDTTNALVGVVWDCLTPEACK